MNKRGEIYRRIVDYRYFLIDNLIRLVFADTFHGIFRLDPSNPSKSLERLVSPEHEIGGGKLFNDVTVGKRSGRIYYTMASKRYISLLIWM